jgi:hypothetical protein
MRREVGTGKHGFKWPRVSILKQTDIASFIRKE